MINYFCIIGLRTSTICPDSLQQKFDVLIDKNSNNKEIIINSDIVRIEIFFFIENYDLCEFF